MKKIKTLVLGLTLTLAFAAYTVGAHAQSTTQDKDGGSCCCCCCFAAWLAS